MVLSHWNVVQSTTASITSITSIQNDKNDQPNMPIPSGIHLLLYASNLHRDENRPQVNSSKYSPQATWPKSQDNESSVASTDPQYKHRLWHIVYWSNTHPFALAHPVGLLPIRLHVLPCPETTAFSSIITPPSQDNQTMCQALKRQIRPVAATIMDRARSTSQKELTWGIRAYWNPSNEVIRGQ